MSIFRQQQDKWGFATALGYLARVMQSRGDLERSTELFAECLPLLHGLGNRVWIARYLEPLAEIAAARGQPERAARLFGAAESLRKATGGVRMPAERPDYERGVAAARAALGEKAFVAAWAEGQALPLEDAIAFALKEPPSI